MKHSFQTIIISAALVSSWAASAQQTEMYEEPPINYSSTPPHDAVMALQAAIASGQITLGNNGPGIMRGLLRELKIPVESQLLVFSKTSLQRGLINPSRPRSLFFNDTCYIGWVPSGLIEVTTMDPMLGPIFYSVNPNSTDTPKHKIFVRDSDCLRCHGGTFVREIPGVLARSVFTSPDGEPMLRFGTEIVDFQTPFTNRWGGWYVTGKHGKALHRGNVVATEMNGEVLVDFKKGANVTELSSYFDSSDYLTNSSDIVALLVFEHQIGMQNTLTRASINGRRMLDYQERLQRDLKEPVTQEPVFDSVKSVLEHSSRDVVDQLLFKDEAELPEGLEGNPAFQKAFHSTAPRALNGDSLKDFCLQGHLFKNRCSYLIYSESFRLLPKPLLNRIHARLSRALSESDPDPRYSYLGAVERSRIRRILLETEPELRLALQ